ncbi:hypothetical protein F4781DRAFT_395573 [Annulohypoxylon bovei var. microspora]|nr:hypothetical protein F4781DRAFT_395573 [Annulohypoxylon bovei var. microspora]
MLFLILLLPGRMNFVSIAIDTGPWKQTFRTTLRPPQVRDPFPVKYVSIPGTRSLVEDKTLAAIITNLVPSYLVSVLS